MTGRASARGPAFTVLDLVETNLVAMALDTEIDLIERRISDPHYAGIEGLAALLADLRAIRDRLRTRLDAFKRQVRK